MSDKLEGWKPSLKISDVLQQGELPSIRNMIESDIISKLCNDLELKKEEILRQRIKELGLKIDFDKEKKARFKSLVCEHEGDKEIWYYNDGSPKGFRILTFRPKKQPIDFTSSELKLGVAYEYY